MKAKYFALAISLILAASMTSGFAAALVPDGGCPPFGCEVRFTSPEPWSFWDGVVPLAWTYENCIIHNYFLNYQKGSCDYHRTSNWIYITTVGIGQTDYSWNTAGLGIDPEVCETYCVEIVDANWPLPFTARDDTGLFYIDNVAPTVEAYDTWGYEGVDIPISGSAIDNCDDKCTLQYRWDFNNDGINDTAWSASPSAIFPATCEEDYYTVVLEVKDCVGNINTDTATVEVRNKEPTVSTTGPYFGTELDEYVAVYGSATDECDADAIQYCWDWNTDDGLSCDTDWSSDGNGQFPSYCNKGDHNIALLAYDGEDTGSSTTTVTISNYAPTAEANGPYYGYEGAAITFDASGSYDVCGPLQYQWTIEGVPQGWSPTPYLDYIYCDNKLDTVTLEVSDGMDSAFDTADVEVYNVAPTVELNGPYEGAKTFPITFTAVFDDQGKCDADWTYYWDWTNDGIFDENGGKSAIEPIVTPHTYASDGSYIVLIEVCDKDGACAADTTEVTVHDYQIPLEPGLNFVSIPLVPLNDDTSIENVLAPIMDKVSEVWYRDLLGNWQTYKVVDPPNGELNEIVPGMGFYLITVPELEPGTPWYGDGNKMYQNPKPYPPSFRLIEGMDGWQMVGHYGLIPNLTEIKSFTSLQTVTWDPEGNPISIIKHYDNILDEFGTSQTTTKVGVGRWIHIRLDNYVGDEIWYVPSKYAYAY